MIGTTIETHCTPRESHRERRRCRRLRRAAATSAGLESGRVVVPDEATPLFFNVPGLMRGQSAILSVGTGNKRCCGVSEGQGDAAGCVQGWRRRGWRSRLGLSAHVHAPCRRT